MSEIVAGLAGRRSVQPNSNPIRYKIALGPRAHTFQEWARITLRRWFYGFHAVAAENEGIGPIPFLGVSAALGVALTLTVLYSASYTVTLNGESVGVVSNQDMVESAIQMVEQVGTTRLGYDYQVEGELNYDFTLTLKSDLNSERDIEDYFYGQLNELSDNLRMYELMVDGQSIGVLRDLDEVNGVLDAIKAQYTTENTVSADFVQKVEINDVYSADTVMEVNQLEAALNASSVGETTYTVSKGDTFNGIAYANDMSVSDLKALNPDTNINKLMVGEVLNVKEKVPVLSVQTTERQTYTEAIECPVQTQEDNSMYKGDSKILVQGEEGEALVEANVTYVNGTEQERVVISTQTVREPTTTIKAIGTKEKPKTASSGTFAWPITGKINSYFGGRYIFGSYSYHSGIDIQASYGAAIKAADGGTVTFAGYKGSYGNLVIITHDNGTQTYYGHNSSLVVSAGQKVYKGQQIAKAGSTGRSTGVHCHFEVRINGSAVNPLSYLP
jgi:murein DD-endopeptidase MepM/ murein hydrolase activator NlpD